MKIARKKNFFRKCDLLEALHLEVTKPNYKFVRALLPNDIVQKTEYDRKHTFTAIDFDLLVTHFQKQA